MCVYLSLSLSLYIYIYIYIYIYMYRLEAKSFVRHNTWLLGLSVAMTLVTICAMTCCKDLNNNIACCDIIYHTMIMISV